MTHHLPPFWLSVLSIAVGVCIGFLWRHAELTRLADKAACWKRQATRLANRHLRDSERIKALQDELDWTRDQAESNAREATRRSRQLAQLIGHPAAGDAHRFVGRDS